MTDPVIGKEIDGYRILGVLGQGGMGVVYQAEEVALSRMVALKMISPSHVNDKTFLRRFRSEAQALARLNSPYIVSIYTLRETQVGVFIVMEYVDGGTVVDRIGEEGMSWEDALPIIKGMLQALRDAHSLGVIHRDIKPGNVMMTVDGGVKITDFGLAKMREMSSDSTVTQGIAGTLYYMPPEQLEGMKEVDHRGDLYALGMTIYQMLTGRLPFDKTSSEFVIMKRIAEGKLPPLTDYSPAIPKGLVKIVTRALEKDPDRRYQSAGEMLEAVEAFEAGVLVNGAEPSRKRLAFFAVPVFVLLLAVLGFFLWPEPSPDPPVENDTRATLVDTLQTELPAAAQTDDPLVLAGDDGGATEQPPVETTSPPPSLSDAADTRSAPTREATPAQEKQVPAEPPAQPPAVRTGRLTVDSSPPGARLLLDGEAQGTTPYDEAALPVGTYRVVLEKDGYEPYSTSVDVTARQAARVSGTLKARMGTLQVSVRPWGDLYIDGEMMREAVDARYTLDLPARRYTITIENPALGRWESAVQIEPGKTVPLNINFSDRVRVNVTAFDLDGKGLQGPIYVDGQPAGKWTPTVIEVPVGLHRVEVRVQGYTQAEIRRKREDAGSRLPGQINFSPAPQPLMLYVMLKKQAP